MKGEEKLIAASGIPIYSYINPASHGFFISLYLKAGGMYEGEEESGITHFLEHIVFRNINRLMGGGLYSYLDRCGLEFNASTYLEMVQFYISGPSSRFREGCELLMKLFEPLDLPRSELELERRRIKAEIREVNDATSLSTFSQGRVFEGTSLSRPITGTVRSVNAQTLASLEAYRRRVFTPDNLFFYVTGGVEDGELLELCKRVGEAKVYAGKPHRNIAPVPADFLTRPPVVYVKNADYTKVRFSFDLDMSRLSVASVDLLYDILLGGYSSDFFIELSERRGVCYDVSGIVERYKNIGTLAFSYEMRAEKLYDALSATVEILERIKQNTLDDDACMKAGYVDSAMMLYDDPRELNFTFAYDNHILNRGYRDLSARADEYRAVTPEMLKEAAKIIFRPENLVLCIKGNKRKIDEGRIIEIISRLGE